MKGIKKLCRAVLVAGAAALLLTACQDQKPAPPGPPQTASSEPPEVQNAITVEDQPSTQQIVWSSGREGTSLTELYRANPNGSGLARLTRNRTVDVDASWSFDLSSIVYMCDASLTQICRARPDGTGVEVLFSGAGKNLRSIHSPKLSPNNKVLVFEADKVTGFGGVAVVEKDIFAYSLETKTLEAVTDDAGLVETSPEWDAPGNEVGLFWLARESGPDTDKASNRLVWLPPGAKDYVFLTQTTEHVKSFDVSRDGGWIVYAGAPSRNAPTNLVVMKIDGSDKKTITQTPFGDERPSFSPDGTKIVYERFDQPTDVDTELYTIGRDGTSLQRITFNDVDDNDADWGNPPVTASIGDVTADEGDSGTTTFSFPVRLSVPAHSALTVDYASRFASALSGNDYTNVSGTLTFAQGEREKTVTVQVDGDPTPETNETFDVLLSNPSAGLVLGQRAGRGLIRNDDVAPTPTPSASPSPSPSPSPSGTGGPGQIAYTSGTAGNFDVWIMSGTGEGKRNLTNDPSSEGNPDLSPDGSTVLFMRGAGGPPDIYQVPAAGGSATRVNGSAGASDVTPDWSPDGGAMAWVANGPSGVDLFTARPPTGSPVQVTTTAEFEAYAEWGKLANGTEAIAFHVEPTDPADPAGVWQVKLLELPGGTVRDFGQGRHPEISPDGRRLLFASNRGGGDYEIYVLDLTQAGASPVALTSNSVDDVTPAWSPDGTQIAWTSHPGGQSDVFTMAANGSNQRNVSNDPAVEDFEPSWGPSPATTAAASAPSGAAMLVSPLLAVLLVGAATRQAARGRRQRRSDAST